VSFLSDVSATAAATRERRAVTALAALVAVSAAVRGVLAAANPAPRYFPDEYIYAALGRSIAHGHLEIRGATTHFPEILQPILAAPLWGLLSTTAAYHAVQVENAVLGSLVAIPVYALARWLDLGRGYALFCAVYALLVPSFTLATFTVADLVAYPLVLTAVVAGVRAVDEPTAARQLVFLVVASLATLARLEYAVLVVAYIVCAVAVERRCVLRVHRVASLALLPAAAVAAFGIAGYYHHVFSIVHANGSLVRWFFVQMLLLTLTAGVVIVPGAVAAMVRPHGRRETVYASFAGALAVLLLAESSVYAASADDFKERYLFTLLPLVAVAFGAYLRDRRPSLKLLVLALAAVIVVAVARLPISTYTAAAATRETDSEFLFAVSYAQDRLGTSTGSLVVAVAASLLAAGAVAVALGRIGRAALAVTLALLAVETGSAVHLDIQAGRQVRAELPADLTWVDDAAPGRVTALTTASQPSGVLRETLYWNPSIEREAVLPGAAATDSFSAQPLRIGEDGALVGVRGAFLLDGESATVIFTGAHRLAQELGLTLWEPVGRARFRALVLPRYSDGWLAGNGAIRAWPLMRSNAVRVSFTLSVPRSRPKAVLMRLGRQRFTIRPGRQVSIACTSGSGPVTLRYSARNVVFDRQLRFVSALLGRLEVADAPPTTGPATRCRS